MPNALCLSGLLVLLVYCCLEWEFLLFLLASATEEMLFWTHSSKKLLLLAYRGQALFVPVWNKQWGGSKCLPVTGASASVMFPYLFPQCDQANPLGSVWRGKGTGSVLQLLCSVSQSMGTAAPPHISPLGISTVHVDIRSALVSRRPRGDILRLAASLA